MLGLIGKKVGMTQVFDAQGKLIPVTVIKVEDNVVIANRTDDKNGYSAAVVATGEIKKSQTTKPYAGQFKDVCEPKKVVMEMRDFDNEVNVGDKLGVDLFKEVTYVDVTGVSKGKGFQGVMKRWGFHGGRATHGSKFHREPGGTGNCTTPGHCFKNTKLPGRMGFRRVTVQNLKIVKIDPELNVILVRGAVPGNKDCTLIVKSAVKK